MQEVLLWLRNAKPCPMLRMRATTKSWIKKANEIVDSYSQLISDYDSLSEDKQKKYKKEYIGALFGYSKFNLENYLCYYDAYVDNKIF